jgi:hypothetical protein
VTRLTRALQLTVIELEPEPGASLLPESPPRLGVASNPAPKSAVSPYIHNCHLSIPSHAVRLSINVPLALPVRICGVPVDFFFFHGEKH